MTRQSKAQRFLRGYRRGLGMTSAVAASLYCGIILFPAYQSSIYRLSHGHIESAQLEIPLHHSLGMGFAAMLLCLLVLFILVPLSALNLLTLCLPDGRLSREQRCFWAVITLEAWLALYVTWPATSALLFWILD